MPERLTAGEHLEGLTDEDLRRTMIAALRLLAVSAVVAGALFWWKAGWQSGLLLGIGAAISAASLWEWMRLMLVVMERMAADPEGRPPRPVTGVVIGFVMRMSLTLVMLYVSLKYLNGTALALAAGLGLGVFSLTIQALRLLRRWTI